MATTDRLRSEYSEQAVDYHEFYDNPPLASRLETELFAAAIDHPTTKGAVILDLGGGAGMKARIALDAGAAAVDVVDFSAEMMRGGQESEAALGRNAIRWFEADVSRPLAHLPLRPQYDIVMANWLFDHCSSPEMLAGLWSNIGAYLRPGGRFLTLRVGNPRAPSLLTGELGYLYRDFEEIPGGLKYRFVFPSPPVDIEVYSMEAMYSGSTEMYEKYGLADVRNEPFENAKVVRENPELLKSFLKDPAFFLAFATKKL
ncbi:S-adenosyl-L-methionine-dependent methyltransferase [Poronia punctata]|nr:S-adenosyl-L-methionine-dependent methyltransferase [Poronia punctata]